MIDPIKPKKKKKSPLFFDPSSSLPDLVAESPNPLKKIFGAENVSTGEEPTSQPEAPRQGIFSRLGVNETRDQGIQRQADDWLGPRRPVVERAVRSSTNIDVRGEQQRSLDREQAGFEAGNEAFSEELSRGPEGDAAREAGTSTFGKQVSLKDAIHSTLQGSPSSKQVADLQAEARGETLIRPAATKGESFAQGFRRGIPVPLVGGDMGATHPDLASEIAGSAAAFIPQQMVAGPLGEGRILKTAQDWLGRRNVGRAGRFAIKEAADGTGVAVAQEARAISNEEEGFADAGINLAAGAALGPVFGSVIHGAGKALKAGARASENVPSHLLQGRAQREAASATVDALTKATEPDVSWAREEHRSNPDVVRVANDYNKSVGLPEIQEFTPVKHPEDFSRKVADWYETAKNDPEDPEVRSAYEAFNAETEAQYQKLVDEGYEFTPTEDAVLDAYDGAASMREDVARKKLRVFTGGTPNALMTPEQNFKFRAVHDVMAHAGAGYEFHADGEFNAALKHSQMYSPLAQRALFTETVGQNANLNYGPNGEFNRANMGKEIFPEQKAAVLPKEFVDELSASRETATKQRTFTGKLDQIEADAVARLRQRRAGRLNAGFEPADLVDEGIILSTKLARGAVDFAQWSKEMVERLGESVKPHLEKIWKDGNKKWASFQKTLEKNKHEFPDSDRLDELFGLGSHGKQFYENNAEGLKEVFGEKLGEFMIRAIAATSPNSEVTSNTTLAMKALKFNLLGKDLTEGFMRTHKGLLEKVFAGEEFTSQKVKAFENNLRGFTDDDEVTVDVWMTRVFFGQEKPSKLQYQFIQRFVRELAKDKGVSPREMQAAIWYGIKGQTEYDRPNYEHGKAAKTYPGEVRRGLGRGYLDDLFEALPGDERLAQVRKVRDEEVTKALKDDPNGPFLDRLKFRDPGSSPLVNGEKYAILTWANPRGKRFSREANMKLIRVLVQHLKDQGHHPILQEGKYGHKEPSVLVPGMTFEQALDFSRAGRQNGFITNEGMFDLNKGTIEPTEGVEFNNHATDFYSEINLGRGDPIKYQMQYGPAVPRLGMDLPPSVAEQTRAAAFGAKFTKVTGKKLGATGLPAVFFTAAENEEDPEKAAKLRAIGSITMALAVGSLVDKSAADALIREMREKLGDIMTGGSLPENVGTYGDRRYWESRLGKLDDLTWARMKQQANRALGEKLDPLGKAFVGEGEKQYMNVAYLMQDPDGKDFIDARVKHWEAEGLRPVVIDDATTRQIADMLAVDAEDLSRSSLKSMTAPEILAVHDLMQASQQAVRTISKFLDETPGLLKEQLDDLEEMMSRHMSRYDAASLKLFEVRSEAGRSLRQFKVIGEMIDTPGFWVHQAAKKLGVKMSEVPTKVADDIKHFLKYKEFPAGSESAKRVAGLEAKANGKRVQSLESQARAMQRQLENLGKPKKEGTSRIPKIGRNSDLGVFIKARATEARARIAARKGTLYSGLDPIVLVDYTILGVEYLHEGAVKLVDFASRLRGEVGEISDPDVNEVYLSAGQQYKDDLRGSRLQKSPGQDTPRRGIVSQRGSQEAGEALEPHRVNLDKPTRTQRIEALEATPIEKSPESPVLEGGTPEEKLHGEARQAKGDQELDRHDAVKPKHGPGLPGKAGQANAFSKVLPNLSPDEQAKLIHYVNGLAPNSTWRGWLNVWKAGLLTNPLTHKINLQGNTAHQALIAGRNTGAVGLDMIFSAARATFSRDGKPWMQSYWDKRTRTFGTEIFKAQAKGVVEGGKKGWYYLTTGFDQDDILSGLLDKQGRTGIKGVDVYTDVVFRTLGAEDKVFKYAALRASIAEQAMLQASRERLSGSQWRARVHEISKNPLVLGDEKGKAMLLQGAEDAAFAIFQDETAVYRRLNALAGGSILEFVIPFRKTVGSIATKGLVDYNPAGALLQIGRLLLTGKADQRKITGLISGGTIGAAAMYLGYRMAEEEKATSTYPRDATERELHQNENRKENALLIDGRWREYGKLPGIGPMISMGVALREYEKKKPEGSFAEGLLKSTLKGTKTTLDQNFLQGTNQALKALDDPDNYGDALLKNYAASVVPAVVRATARGMDRSAREIETVGDAMKNAIPGLSKSLPEKRTSLDFPIEREGGIAGQVFGIGRAPTHRTDPLVQELRRLDYIPLKPGKTGKFGDEDRRRTPDEYKLFAKAAGERTRLRLYEAIDSDEYKFLETDDEKIEYLRDIVSDVRKEIRDEEADPSMTQDAEALTYQPIREAYRSRYAETK